MRTLAVTRTHLAMPAGPATPPPAPPVPGARLERVAPCPIEVWRAFYREVGRRHHWVDGLDWSDAQVRAWLDRPGHGLWAAHVGDAPAGFFELQHDGLGSVRIEYFGLMPGFHGQGLGRWLLEAAIAEAAAMGGREVLLHTCSLDDPAALPNYRRRGFEVVATDFYDTPARPDLCAGPCCQDGPGPGQEPPG